MEFNNDHNRDKKAELDKPVETESTADLDFDLAAASNLVPIKTQQGTSREHTLSLHDLAASSKQIAKMKEPKALSVQTLDHLKIIYPDMADKTVANVYRDLRTRLLQISRGRNFVVMITSLVPKGGSSHIAVNLASSFSFDSTKTSLLVDCNLSSPNLDKVLNVTPTFGLTDFIEDETVTLEQIIYPTGVYRMRVIPVGKRRESTTEYFTSLRMRILMDAIKKRYPDRFVFVDAPSIGQSADAAILADLCDYVLMVVPYGKVTESRIREVLLSLDNRKVTGILMN